MARSAGGWRCRACSGAGPARLARCAPGYDAAMARRTRLELLAADAADCKACDLWRLGTQTVFGEGPESADVPLVGEQPGDQEDLAGEPFVGPGGRLLDVRKDAAGLAREATRRAQGRNPVHNGQ